MCSRDIFECKNICSSRSKYPHGCSNLITSSYSSKLVPRPHAKDRPNCEVSVNNAGAIKWIECNTESSCPGPGQFIKLISYFGFFTIHTETLIWHQRRQHAYLQLGLPCPGAQELPQSRHTCRSENIAVPEHVHTSSTSQVRPKFDQVFSRAIKVFTSNRSLLASKSTASCSSPKEFTHAVPPQEAVRTLNAIVLRASPMHIISLIRALS